MCATASKKRRSDKKQVERVVKLFTFVINFYSVIDRSSRVAFLEQLLPSILVHPSVFTELKYQTKSIGTIHQSRNCYLMTRNIFERIINHVSFICTPSNCINFHPSPAELIFLMKVITYYVADKFRKYFVIQCV